MCFSTQKIDLGLKAHRYCNISSANVCLVLHNLNGGCFFCLLCFYDHLTKRNSVQLTFWRYQWQRNTPGGPEHCSVQAIDILYRNTQHKLRLKYLIAALTWFRIGWKKPENEAGKKPVSRQRLTHAAAVVPWLEPCRGAECLMTLLNLYLSSTTPLDGILEGLQNNKHYQDE